MWVGGGGGGGGGIPSDYLVSTQLQLWLFCCWHLGVIFDFLGPNGLFLGLG